MKGHTKIELFNAKTGELEKTVEDNNMFTNALNSLLNDNIGGDLSDPADIFPLPEKALGGLMLLPEAETEDANNLFPHSFPTATGVYGRTDISGNSMMGIYNAEKSGYSPNKESYTHVWEFPTYQGNGTIACAALTHADGVDYAVITNSSSDTGYPYTTEAQPTAPNKPLVDNKTLGSYDYIATNYNGYIYTISPIVEEISDSKAPRFKVKRCKIIENVFNAVDEYPLQNYDATVPNSSLEEVFEIQLPNTYGEACVFDTFEYEEGKVLLLVSVGRKSWNNAIADTIYFCITEPFIDVYVLDIGSRELSFIRTLNVPIYNKNTGTAQITESGRDVRRAEDFSYGEYSYSYRNNYSGTDYHLCPPLSGELVSTTASWHSNTHRSTNYTKSGKIVYRNGYIFYSPFFYEPYTQIVRGDMRMIWNTDIYIRMNIFTNEFDLIKMNRLYTDYSIIQLYNNRSIYAIGNKAYNLDTNVVYNSSVWNTRIRSSSSSYTSPSESCPIYFTRGIYGLYNYDRGVYSSRITRSRNNMYLATINNLPQPLTKNSEQTMRVTYTISNGV